MNRLVIELIKLIKIFSLCSNRKSFNNLKNRKVLKIFFGLRSFLFTYEGLFFN